MPHDSWLKTGLALGAGAAAAAVLWSQSNSGNTQEDTATTRPRRLLIALSGKRAAGKDYVGGQVRCELEKGLPGCKTLRLAFSDQCKREFAVREGLDFEKLMNDRDYKEKHRAKMTKFYEETAAMDPQHFMVGVLNEAQKFFEQCGDFPSVVTITDARLETECEVIRDAHQQYGADQAIIVRVTATEKARRERNWAPDPVKDNHFTETGLDEYDFDLFIDNSAPFSDEGKKVKQQIQAVILPIASYPVEATSGRKKKTKIHFITGNAGKMQLFKQATKELGLDQRDLPWEIIQQDIDLPEYQGNPVHVTTMKAKAAAEIVRGPCVVDDVSLCFHAMEDFPSTYIKWLLRSVGNEGLHKCLIGFEDFRAHVNSTMGYCEGPGAEPMLFQGQTLGTIVPPRGDQGIGFDPSFVPYGFEQTYAEMGWNSFEKATVNEHRRSVGLFYAFLEEKFNMQRNITAAPEAHTLKRQLQAVFKHLDKNKDGNVTHDEMKSKIKENGRQAEAVAKKYMALIDGDKDGKISEEEFVGYFEGLVDKFDIPAYQALVKQVNEMFQVPFDLSKVGSTTGNCDCADEKDCTSECK